MYSALLLFLCIVPILILWKLLVRAHKSGRKLWAAILGLTLFHELVLIVFPIWHSAFTDFSQERLMITSPDPIDLIAVLLGEAIFVTMFGVGFCIRLRRKMTVPANYRLNKQLSRSDILFWAVLTVIGVIIYVGGFVFVPHSFQNYVAQVEGTYSRSSGELIYNWFKSIFWFPSLLACTVVVTGSKNEKYPIWISWIGGIALLFLLLTGITSGLRGRIIWVASLLLVLGYLKGKKINTVIAFLLIALMIPIFTILPGVVRSISYSYAESGGSRVDLTNEVFHEIIDTINNKDNLLDSVNELLDAFSWRAQGPRNSTVLYKLHDSGNSGGFTPYIGGIFFPLPRIIWPDKPVIGSSDGTTFGRPAYIVMRIGYGLPYHTMGPYLASAAAYWSLGWFGVFLCGFATGLFWKLILTLCDNLNQSLSLVIALSFSAALLIDGLLTAFVPFYTIIVCCWKMFIPIVVFYKVLQIRFFSRDIGRTSFSL